jgi:hypothetical protein
MSITEEFGCVGFDQFNRIHATKLLASLGLSIPVDKIWHFSKNEFFEVKAGWAFRRGFPMIEEINRALGRINHAGLFQKWYGICIRIVIGY